MAVKEEIPETTPFWESRLWSLIGSGSGLKCPLYEICRSRAGGRWCPNEHIDKLIPLADSEFRHPESYEFVKNDMLCYILRLLERLATKYLRSIRTFSPETSDDLFSLLSERYRVEVRKVPLRTCHAALWQLENGWIIHLGADENATMRRYVLLHEIFHVLAHSKTTPVFNKLGLPRGEFNELLADFFSISILLPSKRAENAITEIRDVDKIATTYQVPQPFVYLRLKRMGLI